MKRKTHDWELIIGLTVFFIAILLSLVWGLWYVQNCAMVPAAQAPAICFASR